MRNDSSPLFLLGMQRSGTSLVRAFLACHPQIAMPIKGETQFFAKWSDKIDSLETVEERHEFHQKFMAESKVSQWGIDWKDFEPDLKGSETKSKQYFDSLMNYYAKQKGKACWGEKSTSHIQHVDRLFALYPEAKYLLIVRDPRDSFCSARSVKWNKGKKLCPQRYGQEWAEVYARAVGFLLRLGADWKIVRHESFVEQTRSVIKDICTWLDEPFSEALLKPHNLEWEQNSSFDDQNWSKGDGQQYTPELKIDPSTVGRWKNLLSREEALKIEEAAYNSMLTFGYEVSQGLIAPSAKLGWKKRFSVFKERILSSFSFS
jgi:hypothetical protein